jgi:predicted RNA-binding Zn-ribbon protein involved in translation (DUF1610 family)
MARVIVRCPECGATSPVHYDPADRAGIRFACFACGRIARTMDNRSPVVDYRCAYCHMAYRHSDQRNDCPRHTLRAEVAR